MDGSKSCAIAVGCWAQASFNICEVPDGGAVEPDGAILGPHGMPVANACHTVCPTSPNALIGTGELPPSSVPAPDPSLGCAVIPVPTPSNPMGYCCPCGGAGSGSNSDAEAD